MDPKNPPLGVLVKVGSIARHVEEFMSLASHPLDKVALDGLLEDPEVAEWLEAMDDLGLLPVKR